MRKVWTSTRNGIPGIYVEWYDDQKRRRSKYFAPHYKKLVKHFVARKFSELNSDVRPAGAVIDVDWAEFAEMYENAKKAAGVGEKHLSELRRTLDLVPTHTNIPSTKHLTAQAVQRLTQGLLDATTHPKSKESTPKPLSRNTINSYLRAIKAAVNWGQKNQYIDKAIEIEYISAPQKPVRILTATEIKNLLAACGNDQQWKMRIYLALVTGLRKSDIDVLKITDINIEMKTLTCRDSKTGKVHDYQPLPDAAMPHITKFILEEVETGQIKLFRTKFSKRWYTICRQAGLPGLQFHDLRRTFASLQANAGTPLPVVKELMKHSSIETTMTHYIATSGGATRDAVNKLDVKNWL